MIDLKKLHEKLTAIVQKSLEKYAGQEHSNIVGGSTADRVSNCPGSVKQNKPLPQLPASSYAKKGTALHTCMELLLSDAVENPEDLIGWTHPNGVKITADMVTDKIEPALYWFDEVLKPDEFFIEAKVELVSVMPGAFGTADIVFTKKVEVEYEDSNGEVGEILIGGVVDWKFGDGVPVIATNNSQMKFYLRGALEAGYFEGCEELEAYIFQPSAKASPEDYANSCIYTNEELEIFATDLRGAVETAMEENAPLCAGAHCHWCPSNEHKVCAEINRAVVAGPLIDITGAPTPEKVAEWRELAKTMKVWLDNLDDLTLRYNEAGMQVPGTKLVESFGHYKYVDEKKALAMLARAGVPAADRYTKKIISKTAAEKLLKKNGGVPKNWAANLDRPRLGNRLVDASSPGKPVVSAGAAIKALSKTLAITNVKK